MVAAEQSTFTTSDNKQFNDFNKARKHEAQLYESRVYQKTHATFPQMIDALKRIQEAYCIDDLISDNMTADNWYQFYQPNFSHWYSEQASDSSQLALNAVIDLYLQLPYAGLYYFDITDKAYAICHLFRDNSCDGIDSFVISTNGKTAGSCCSWQALYNALMESYKEIREVDFSELMEIDSIRKIIDINHIRHNDCSRYFIYTQGDDYQATPAGVCGKLYRGIRLTPDEIAQFYQEHEDDIEYQEQVGDIGEHSRSMRAVVHDENGKLWCIDYEQSLESNHENEFWEQPYRVSLVDKPVTVMKTEIVKIDDLSPSSKPVYWM